MMPGPWRRIDSLAALCGIAFVGLLPLAAVVLAPAAAWSDRADRVPILVQLTASVLLAYLMESARMSQLSADDLYNLMETRRLVITPASIKAAITVIVTTPIILLYPFLQKHLAKGLMIGAIEG